jgi:hypothetical protein
VIKEAYEAGCSAALVHFGIAAPGQTKQAAPGAGFFSNALESAKKGLRGAGDWAAKPMDDLAKLRQARVGQDGISPSKDLASDLWGAMKDNPWQTGAAGLGGLGVGAGTLGAGYAMGSPDEQTSMDHIRALLGMG